MPQESHRYACLMETVQARHTSRAFAPSEVPREHFEMILEAARHAPSGANCQPWHFIVVTDLAVKGMISDIFVEEQLRRLPGWACASPRPTTKAFAPRRA